jgi:hypothetical protein
MTTTAITVPRLAELTFDGASHDFDFLNGSFDITNRTLVGKPFTGSNEWKEFPSTAVARTHLGGGVSMEEIDFPETNTYGLSFRVFDVGAKRWSIYWVSSSDGRLGPPVHGAWEGDSCRLLGEDVVDGVTVHVSYSWSDVTETTAHWEQAYSLDGETWETNWTMDWVRRNDPPDHRRGPKLTSDFDFVVGDWQIDHRRLTNPLTGSDAWSAFASPWTAWTYFNGAVTVDELGLADETTRGLTLRLFDPETRQWSIYWVNSTLGRMDEHPVVGQFSPDGTGVFEAPDVYDGKEILCRFTWSDITATTAKWRQEFSLDDGETWKANWYMDSTRLPSSE